MKSCTVNQLVLRPISVRSITPVCGARTGTVRFEINSQRENQFTIPFNFDKEVIGVELFTYKNTGLIVIFEKETITCHLYHTDHGTMTPVGKIEVFKVPEYYTTAKEAYGWLVGNILTNEESHMWFFNYGNAIRSKLGTILNYMMINGDIKPFTGKFGDNFLSFKDRYIQISKPDGGVIYQSRVSCLQKTLLRN
ncbi:hypothetical protein NFI00_000171 [Salmonella enterica]|nr:hypothetical protein [Salmonella enterica subsp. enterica serovar Minnesota]EJI5696468.1 hypothetical protein [Salmonella enterica]